MSYNPLALASSLTSAHCAHLPYPSIPSARAWCVFILLFLQIYACSWAKHFWPRTALHRTSLGASPGRVSLLSLQPLLMFETSSLQHLVWTGINSMHSAQRPPSRSRQQLSSPAQRQTVAISDQDLPLLLIRSLPHPRPCGRCLRHPQSRPSTSQRWSAAWL